MTGSDPFKNQSHAAATALAAQNWPRLGEEIDRFGHAVTDPILTQEDCATLIAAYEEEPRYRKRVVMARHGYGQGEYRYFAYPLPGLIETLRTAAYPHLAPIANRWAEALGSDRRYPSTHAAFIGKCHGAGQERPTPLILRYGPGDYNRLHQDLYGEIAFPLQMIFLLSEPGTDFEGGELVLTEQRARMQSRAEVVPLTLGAAAIVAVNDRPGQGPRGFHRLRMRHGVSRLRSGQRYTLGIIFHDAR